MIVHYEQYSLMNLIAIGAYHTEGNLIAGPLMVAANPTMVMGMVLLCGCLPLATPLAINLNALPSLRIVRLLHIAIIRA